MANLFDNDICNNRDAWLYSLRVMINRGTPLAEIIGQMSLPSPEMHTGGVAHSHGGPDNEP